MTTVYPGDTLTATPATSTGNPAPSTAYQWLQDGEELPGATSNTLVLTDDHSDHLISVRQSISNFLSTDHAISTVLGPVQQYPAALFKSSEVGVWYDPSDVANLNWRRNILAYTEQFDNAAWFKSNSSLVTNAAIAPDNTITAELLYPTTSGTNRRVIQYLTLASGATYTGTIHVKAAGKSWVAFGPVRGNSGNDQVFFNISTGARGTVGSSASASSIMNIGNGWYRLSVTMSKSAGVDAFFLDVCDADGSTSVTTSGTDGVLIWGAQLELGSTATSYQRISNVTTEVLERFPYATLYQDTVATTPVTTPGQSVALMLDKSRGLPIGPELVTNGTFDNGTAGWTASALASISVSGGILTAVYADNGQEFWQNVPTVAGQLYQLSVNIVSKQSGNVVVGVRDNNTRWFYTSTGVKVVTFTATGASTRIFLGANNDQTFPTTTAFDNISVREFTGYPAIQATAASRPIYAVEPVTGRRNLLTYTEQFDNAVWEKLSSVTVAANVVLAPNGTTTADKIIETATNNFHGLRPGGLTAGLIYTFQVSLKEAERRYAVISLGGNDTALAGGGLFVDLRNGSVISAVGSKLSSYSVNDQGNGWFSYRISVNMTGVAETPYAFVFIIDNSTHTIGVGYGYKIYTGDGTSGIYIWGAQIETGSTATAYQCVASQYDVTESGVPTLHYLSFDGVDDVMQTGTITPGVDKVQVFAGVRKLSDAVYGIVVEFGINIPNGSFWLLNGDGSVSPGPQWQFRSRGTTTWGDATTAAISPITSVLTGLGDISGDSAILRVNGVQASSSTADQSTGNYLPQPLYVGARGGPVISLNGRIYGLITRFGANLSNDQITRTETWIARKTGITL